MTLPQMVQEEFVRSFRFMLMSSPPEPALLEEPDERRVRRRMALAALTLVVVLSVAVGLIACSYIRALFYPGEAPFLVRTVEWVRDHGGSPLVNAAENWWYARKPPSGPGPADSRELPEPLARGMGAPPALRPLSARPSPGEGRWMVDPVPDRAAPASMLWTVVHPDSSYPQGVAAVVRFDQNRLSAHLIAGTRQPQDTDKPDAGRIPQALWPRLVATFNSGFKMVDAQGGYYSDNRAAIPLREGAASLVIDQAGRISVDQWGRDRLLESQVVAVRQNLALIVDRGRVVPGLDDNSDRRWGSARNQLQYTWRSALGVDASGDLYYVAGDNLTLSSLARAVADTGAVRAMELDIHPYAVHLFAYRHVPGVATPQPSVLMATMRGSWNRYLRSDQRDFFVLTAR